MKGDRSPAAMRRKKGKAAGPAPRGPRGSSSTIINNPGNPAANINAGDVALHHVAAGLSIGTKPVFANPTVASGETTASIAAAVVADSGALAAGTYRVEITLGFSGAPAAGKHITVQHRNAADAATLQSLGLCPAGESATILLERVVVAANERIRAVIGAVAAAAAEVTQAQIRAYLL